MLKSTFSIFLLIILCQAGNFLHATHDSIPVQKKFNNEVSITLLGQNLFYSINYTSVLLEKNRSTLKQQFSFTYLKQFPKVISYSLLKEFGKRNHHLVAGLGYIYFMEGYHYETNYHHFSPISTLGYSLSNPERRFKLGLHLNLFYSYNNNTLNIAPWGGLTIGYKFNTPDVLKNLSKKIPDQPQKFSIIAGYEGEVGTGKLSINGIGSNTALLVTNSVFIKYNLRHLYFKTIAGFCLLSTNKLKNNETTVTIFDKKPFFVQYGVGVGCLIATIHHWRIFPEIQTGMYTHVPDLNLVIESPQFESFSGFTPRHTQNVFSYSQNYSHRSTPWYFKTVINLEKEVTEKLSLSLGLSYKHSIISNKAYSDPQYNPFKTLTNQLIGLNVGLNFKL